MFGGAVPRDAENRNVRLEGEDFLGADTLFRGLADQRNGFTTLIDGGDIDDAIWGNPTINIPQDAVQEFKVFRNQFDAEYGSALAAVVSVVTKSGTNALAGTASYFGRDKALNSKNYFAVGEKPTFNQTRFGGTLGGPIARNRTHFFASYEHNELNTVKIISLPAINPFAASNNGEFPSGSRNQATRSPPEVVQIPRSSWSIPS